MRESQVGVSNRRPSAVVIKIKEVQMQADPTKYPSANDGAEMCGHAHLHHDHPFMHEHALHHHHDPSEGHWHGHARKHSENETPDRAEEERAMLAYMLSHNQSHLDELKELSRYGGTTSGTASGTTSGTASGAEGDAAIKTTNDADDAPIEPAIGATGSTEGDTASEATGDAPSRVLLLEACEYYEKANERLAAYLKKTGDK